MKYDPQNELTDEQLKELSEDDFFEYLDAKAEYLNQYKRPLGQYHTKRFAYIDAAIQNREIGHAEYKRLTKKGLEGDLQAKSRIEEYIEVNGLIDPKYLDPQIKNFKTHRSQWFD